MPSKFYGINTSFFGNSKNNPFLLVKDVALNINTPIDDRMRAVRYLDRIPYKNNLKHTSECAFKIIDDISIPVGERFFFFSNNESDIKLSDHLTRSCHEQFF